MHMIIHKTCSPKPYNTDQLKERVFNCKDRYKVCFKINYNQSGFYIYLHWKSYSMLEN